MLFNKYVVLVFLAMLMSLSACDAADSSVNPLPPTTSSQIPIAPVTTEVIISTSSSYPESSSTQQSLPLVLSNSIDEIIPYSNPSLSTNPSTDPPSNPTTDFTLTSYITPPSNPSSSLITTSPTSQPPSYTSSYTSEYTSEYTSSYTSEYSSSYTSHSSLSSDMTNPPNPPIVTTAPDNDDGSSPNRGGNNEDNPYVEGIEYDDGTSSDAPQPPSNLNNGGSASSGSSSSNGGIPGADVGSGSSPSNQHLAQGGQQGVGDVSSQNSQDDADQESSKPYFLRPIFLVWVLLGLAVIFVIAYILMTTQKPKVAPTQQPPTQQPPLN